MNINQQDGLIQVPKNEVPKDDAQQGYTRNKELLYYALRTVQAELGAGIPEVRKLSLCQAVYRVLDKHKLLWEDLTDLKRMLQSRAANWEHYSGCPTSPVPDPNVLLNNHSPANVVAAAEAAHLSALKDGADFWAGNYGSLRHGLLDFLTNTLFSELPSKSPAVTTKPIYDAALRLGVTGKLFISGGFAKLDSNQQGTVMTFLLTTLLDRVKDHNSGKQPAAFYPRLGLVANVCALLDCLTPSGLQTENYYYRALQKEGTLNGTVDFSTRRNGDDYCHVVVRLNRAVSKTKGYSGDLDRAIRPLPVTVRRNDHYFLDYANRWGYDCFVDYLNEILHSVKMGQSSQADVQTLPVAPDHP